MTKEEVILAVKKHWIKEFGTLDDETADYHRNGYFVAGFVQCAIEEYQHARLPIQPAPAVDQLTASWNC